MWNLGTRTQLMHRNFGKTVDNLLSYPPGINMRGECTTGAVGRKFDKLAATVGKLGKPRNRDVTGCAGMHARAPGITKWPGVRVFSWAEKKVLSI